MPGACAWCVADRVGRRAVGPLAVLAICLTIAKSANSPLMFGNIGYCFLVAKSAKDWRENRQREGWRGVVASLIGGQNLGNIGKIVSLFKSTPTNTYHPPSFFQKNDDNFANSRESLIESGAYKRRRLAILPFSIAIAIKFNCQFDP